MTELLALSEGGPALQRKLQLLASRSDLIHSLQRVVRLRLKIQKQHLNASADTFSTSNPQLSLKINLCDSAAAL